MFAPAVIKWAREVAGLGLDEAAYRVRVDAETFRAWEDEKDERKPSDSQAALMSERFNVPFDYLLGDEPPKRIRLPDGYLRTPPKSKALSKPSFDLQDAMFDAEYKQEWLSEHRRSKGLAPVMPSAVPRIMNAVDDRIPSFTEPQKMNRHLGKMLDGLIRDLWEIGFIVIRNGVVEYEDARKLKASEFSGFALADYHAPAIFINANATKVEQALAVFGGLEYIFKWDGERAEEMRFEPELASSHAVAEQRGAYGEQRKAVYADVLDAAEQLREVARNMPAAGRANGRSAGIQSLEGMDRMLEGLMAKGGGGFWSAVTYKCGGPGFLSAVVSSTVEDDTLIRDAFDLTGLKGYPFDELAVRMGFPHVFPRRTDELE